MISNQLERICREEISKIENYEQAVNDPTRVWHCHHRAEITPSGTYSRKDLIEQGIYYKRPASELIFLTPSDHKQLHIKAIKHNVVEVPTGEMVVTINYSGLDFTLDFSKRGVPEIYCRGEHLKASYNKSLKRWYIQVYLGANYEGIQGAYRHGKWNVGYYSTPRYRLVAAGAEKLRNGEFDYEKFKGMQVDHIDNNPENDTPSNLRWTTRKRNNRRKNARMLKSQNYNCNRHDGEIVRATRDGEERLFKNVSQCCKELGFSHVLGYRVINKSDYAKTAKGWVLEYVPLTYGVLQEDAKEI